MDLRLEGRGHSSQVEYGMHFGVHRNRLAMTVSSQLGSIVVWTVVIVARRDYLPALHHHGPEGEAHGTLGSCLSALRQIKLGLVHDFADPVQIRQIATKKNLPFLR